MDVCVVGLGKIGLPLAVQIASKGHRVRGVDISPPTVDAVNAGLEPFPGEVDLRDRLADVNAAGLFTATLDGAGAVASSQVVLVVVPLLVTRDKKPDFRAIDSATSMIASSLRPGTLVIYETTLPVHTTRQRFAPMLEGGSGLSVGDDLFVCHSPERVFSGRVFEDLRRYPKLVGGIDSQSARRAVQFYESALDFDERPELGRRNGVWDLGSVEAAELAKLAETTYRDINIALANEFAVFSDRNGIDIYRVIEAANSQPFSHIHRPGIAVGGHCIPVYPHFYLASHADARLPAVAREINASMPAYAVQRLADELGTLADLRVVVLGAAYRGGVKETAFSGVFGTVEALRNAGARPLVHDPLFEDAELEGMGLHPYHFGEACDAAILQADHPEYAAASPADLPGIRALVDGRAVTDPDLWVGCLRLVVGAPSRACGS